ncbi:chaperone protein dnaJ 11, chloroplastic-like [Glycine soja]|uniref:chaperone protein dnaJ 11, chloroplastic n=1 Tax=Glycine max TaxID=3847 RepID=UPI000233844D|nr:chaperone protein dnaJ 11, chloroplastic [Glycine max]XP_028181457.1 chaperone protein dnaJ 11, chloroplastic-like [Glycine soja]|eukprot:XP_003533165.1 chaperone protein dnaJ 11, chloroplastic [Glycine max]
MISFVSFSASLPAIKFSGNAMASSSCRVKSRPIVAFATAEARSSWTEQLRPSYLNSSYFSLYDILGIPSDASNQEIKAAYQRLARVYHPDMAAIDRKNSSADEFMKIHAAYSTLSDPDKRANYDRSLFWRQWL